MYTFSKSFHFTASHVIYDLESTHPESSLHVHNYTIKVEIKKKGKAEHVFIWEPIEFDKIRDWINKELQIKNLNYVFGKMPTTNENICHWLYYAFKGSLNIDISAIELSDKPGNLCRYEE